MSLISSVETTKLIEEVEKRPALYKKSLKEYADANLKKSLWEEVCEAVVPNWLELTSEERRKQGRHYLETSLIIAKGSLEKAKTSLDKLCTLKSLLPNFFSKHDVKNELFEVATFILQATMPKLLKNNYRLYCIKLLSTDFDASNLFDFHRFAILMSEFVKANDYSLGFTCIIDCTDINILNMVTKFNILELRDSITILTEGYGFRINAIHLISSSKTVEALISLLKQVVSAKIGNRIQSHKSVESLYEDIDKEFLPNDYGGNQPSLKEVNHNWVDVLSQKENVSFFREICKARTDEKNRLTSNFNDQILGMPGSFRVLTVD